jgi:hypothetical protein
VVGVAPVEELEGTHQVRASLGRRRAFRGLRTVIVDELERIEVIFKAELG